MLFSCLVELEVEEDFSMVYENQSGFRASTCTPFLFYDLDYEIVSPLLIHPIAFASTAFKGKKDSEITKKVGESLASVKKVNGTFSIIFSNKNFTPIKPNKVWKDLFVKLSKDSSIN